MSKGSAPTPRARFSFMDVWDAMCRTIMSAGYRRGAMMATLRVDHPDIEAFIEAKREPGRLRMFNLSVLVDRRLHAGGRRGRALAAVSSAAPVKPNVAKVLPARELWDKIMRATYAYAEPGVIFIDRINRRNNLWYCEEIRRPIRASPPIPGFRPPRVRGRSRDLVGRPFAAIADGATWRERPLRLLRYRQQARRVAGERPKATRCG